MNMTDNMLLLSQMFTAKGAQSGAPSQQASRQEDGSSFRELMEQKQPASKPHPAKQKSEQVKPNEEAPQDAPAQNPQSESQTQTPDAAPADTTILDGLLPNQFTVESTALPTIPNTPEAIAFAQKHFVHSYGQAQGQTTAQAAAPQEGRTLPQTMQAQQPVQTQANVQNEAQPIQPKADPKADLTLNQPKQQGDLSGLKGLANGQTAPSTGKDVNVTQGNEAPAQPLFRQLEGTPIKVGEAQTADTTAPNFEQQLAKQVNTALEKGAQRIEIQLTPEHLGKLTIELTRAQDGSMRLVLHASTERAANLLSEHSSGLASLLRGNSQTPVQVEIQQQNQEHGQREEQQQQQSNQQQQQQRQQQQQSQDFLQQLRLGILPLESEAS